MPIIHSAVKRDTIEVPFDGIRVPYHVKIYLCVCVCPKCLNSIYMLAVLTVSLDLHDLDSH